MRRVLSEALSYPADRRGRKRKLLPAGERETSLNETSHTATTVGQAGRRLRLLTRTGLAIGGAVLGAALLAGCGSSDSTTDSGAVSATPTTLKTLAQIAGAADLLGRAAGARDVRAHDARERSDPRPLPARRHQGRHERNPSCRSGRTRCRTRTPRRSVPPASRARCASRSPRARSPSPRRPIRSTCG